MAPTTGGFDPTRRTALVAGILYLVTFIASIPAAILLGPAQSDPTATLAAIPDSQIRLAAALELVNALACFGTAVAVFSVVKREHEGLALGFVTTRMFEAAALVVGIIAILTLATLREAAIATDGAASGHVAARYWSLVIGPGMASWNALMFGTLLYRARLVPRAIPALGIAGAPLFIAFVFGTMLGITEPGTALHGLAVAPFFIWELVVGLWMTFKGFNRSAPIVVAAMAESAEGSPSRFTSTAPVAVATKAGAA
jgi:hypothetical protein